MLTIRKLTERTVRKEFVDLINWNCVSKSERRFTNHALLRQKLKTDKTGKRTARWCESECLNTGWSGRSEWNGTRWIAYDAVCVVVFVFWLRQSRLVKLAGNTPFSPVRSLTPFNQPSSWTTTKRWIRKEEPWFASDDVTYMYLLIVCAPRQHADDVTRLEAQLVRVVTGVHVRRLHLHVSQKRNQ